MVSQTIRKVRKDETYWRCQGSWISRQKKSAHSATTDVLRVGEICLEISSPLIFYSPDNWSRREKKVKEQERGGAMRGRPAHNGGKGGKLFGGQDES